MHSVLVVESAGPLELFLCIVYVDVEVERDLLVCGTFLCLFHEHVGCQPTFLSVLIEMRPSWVPSVCFGPPKQMFYSRFNVLSVSQETSLFGCRTIFRVYFLFPHAANILPSCGIIIFLFLK